VSSKYEIWAEFHNKPLLVRSHMLSAYAYSLLSKAGKRKVGAIVVKDGSVIGIGYNGTPPGWDNACEDEHGVTKPEVIHAEQNALDKVTRSTVSSINAVMFCTTAPCLECAKRIHGAGVISVYYREKGRNSVPGLEYLEKAGIPAKEVEL
jgi:dCMP deaminase